MSQIKSLIEYRGYLWDQWCHMEPSDLRDLVYFNIKGIDKDIKDLYSILESEDSYDFNTN